MSVIERAVRISFHFGCSIVMSACLLGARADAQMPGIGRGSDAVKDFSISNNPNGPWSYGCSSSATEADFHAFTHGKTNPTNKKLEYWSGYKDTPDGCPGVTHSKANETIQYITITHPPDCLNLHPGPQGNRAIVRFTVPGRGTYKVQGTFKALDRTTTDPHVLVNGKDAVAIKPINDGHRRQDFSFTQQFDRNDTIDFAVGYGGNGYTCDSTGLMVTVTSVGAVAALPVAPATVAGRKPPELVTLSTNYGRQFKLMAADGEQRIKQAQAGYAAALAELENAAKRRGDLDGVIAVRAESARFGKGTEPSVAEKSAMPESLSQQRSRYDTELTRLVGEIQEKQTQVQKQYLAELETLERHLTQRGNIEGALEVRSERAHVANLAERR